MRIFLLSSFFILFFPMNIYSEQIYVIPPTSSTSGYVPVISDEMMEQCVKVYNQSQWLSEELNGTYVDSYSQYSVNDYNEKANRVNSMINWFNINCAGKQSYSACKAAQKLNREKGLPEQPCY